MSRNFSCSRSAFLRSALRVAAAAVFATAGSLAAAGEPVSAAPAAWCGQRCDELVREWSLTAHQVIAADNGYENPLPASRALAMMHLAMHDALNGAAPRYARYVPGLTDKDADPAVAMVSAAHDALLALYPKQRTLLAASLKRSLHDAGIAASVERGRKLGQQFASGIVKARSNDGAGAQEAYTPRTTRGAYRYVPDTKFILMPHWRKVQPFALRSPSQFRVAPPPALDSAEYRRAFDEVKAFGAQHGAKRSEDQSHYAAFWYELSDVGWNRIARVVTGENKLDLWSTARLFAHLNAAMADAYIAGWDSKVHYDFWRPVTAIRATASGDHGVAAADAKWNSFLPTPPIQDYPSTHSALGAAAAAVLAAAYGRDDVAFGFTSTSAVAGNPARRFASFSDVARENADSRVMAGLHFRFATDAGLKLGEQVGRHSVAHHLLPLK